ncbi:response regulator transcription factor [Hymenobacter taeanensis]|uniref:Response regulator transcription factor n=1 Tax=Hymenobacter taeanensis TaxID=2735321 RepID=A0A6M6BHD4_9BACT|nr:MULTISPECIES: response regulator transcription factor [Hymenobacter]QJX47194.1 response regulator transcription factor [Hymenobacter taeanensis]UOQ81110.1 response regulator transcription factor [Hymenobacter sp. 5414T-23]
MIRVLLVDDHSIVRNGIQALLAQEPDIEVVGQTDNGQSLLELLAHTPTDIVLMDVAMPVLDGFATMPLLQEQFPGVRVLVLSMLGHETDVYRMMQAGAAGYVMKNAESQEFVYAIRMVATGRPFMCTELGLSLLQRLVKRPNPDVIPGTKRRPGNLTEREKEVLQLLAEGFTNAEIAEKLFTSKRTIETHRQNIIEKTQVKNTAALMRYAVSHGLIA